jgi:hypothetical protein
MKKYALIAALLFFGVIAYGQIFDKDTIIYNGNSDKHINLVILSDGYTSGELSKFVTDATYFTSEFFSATPFSNYKKYFNVFIIKVPSNQSGASHPGTATDVTEPAHPVSTVDNYFGSTFDYGNIHRLLVATKTSAISNVLAGNFPNYDQALILVNSPYYGGSGGYYTVASTHTSSAEIAIHELGHSFSGLNDEYWAGDIYASEGKNMTKQTDPLLVKWKNWMGINAIGIYQHCCGGNSLLWYKPHQNCKMQYLGTPFCSVCVQGTIEKIHSIVTPLESYYPDNTSVTATSYPLKIKLFLIAPEPNTLKRTWFLNGSTFLKNIDSLFLEESNLVLHTNTLEAIIEDTTQLLRVDNHSAIHISSVSWSIEKGIVGIKDIESKEKEINIDLFPNPATDYISVRSAGNIEGVMKIEIHNLQGKRLRSLRINTPGENYIDMKEIQPGIYLYRIFNDNKLISSGKIIRQ